MLVRATLFIWAALAVFSPMTLHVLGQNAPSNSPEQGSGVITVPGRPSEPIYKGQQGEQRSEHEFTPSSRRVTIKLRVEDPSGYFLPNIRPENFAIYEDGVRQKDASVEIEYAAIVASLLMEFGGRYQELDRALALEVGEIGRQFLDALVPADKVGILKYTDNVEVLADFGKPREELKSVFDQVSTPGFSETNLHDALLDTLHRYREQLGELHPEIQRFVGDLRAGDLDRACSLLHPDAVIHEAAGP